MGALAIRNVRKSYNETTHILKGIDLEIEAGEFLILVGPSGCGKSTLLGMIAGLDQPSTGSIHIADRDVTNLPSKDRDIAMVFQSYALYPHMTVAQNIAFGLEIRKVPKPEREAAVQRQCWDRMSNTPNSVRVNATVNVWAQDNKYGKRVNAQLLGVQFYADGDSFGGGAVGSVDDFDDLAEGAEADSLV